MDKMVRQSGLPYYALEGSLHILGVFFYVVSFISALLVYKQRKLVLFV